MTLSIRQLAPTFAALVTGTDLCRPLDDATVRHLQDAVLRYGVLVFQDQAIDDAAQVAFSRHFGPMEIAPDTTRVTGAHPEILELVEIGDTTKHQSLAQMWHSDGSYRPVPSYLTTLRSLEICPVGGETWFADACAAYDALPTARKRELESLQVVHDYEHSRQLVPNTRPPTAEEAALQPTTHPLCRTHPGTGRRLLYLGNHTREIVGLPLQEGRALLRELLDWTTQERFVYKHKWSVGDFVVWDNRGTLHRVTPYDATRYRRVMHRTEISGAVA